MATEIIGEFDDRIATARRKIRGSDRWASGHLFVCQKTGHVSPVPKRLELFVPGYLTDAKSLRADHDSKQHSPFRAATGERPQKDVTVEQLCNDWLEYGEQLVAKRREEGPRAGIADGTLEYYLYVCNLLRRALPACGIHSVLDITSVKIAKVIAWFGENTSSIGPMSGKALSSLKTMIKFQSMSADWVIPRRLIGDMHREKLQLSSEEIVRLIAELVCGSVERAVAILKRSTGSRDVEIYESHESEFQFDLVTAIDSRIVRFAQWNPTWLHAKGRYVAGHTYLLTESCAEELRPFVMAAREPDAPAAGALFHIDGRRIDRSSLRKRLDAASARAGIRRVQTIGVIRNEVATILSKHMSLDELAKFTGHKDTRTLERHYIKRQQTKTPTEIVDILRKAQILEAAMPIDAPILVAEPERRLA